MEIGGIDTQDILFVSPAATPTWKLAGINGEEKHERLSERIIL
jgi:hypothetical protein